MRRQVGPAAPSDQLVNILWPRKMLMVKADRDEIAI